jgi:hypothetical protein
MRTNREVVFGLWCRLTGQDMAEVDAAERAAFLARPQTGELSAVPYGELLDAAITAASRGSLPLETWLSSVKQPSRSP